MSVKRLWLIRHAKSRQDGSTDIARKLSYRGYEQCIEMGSWLAGVDMPPSLFIASSAERTMTTAHILNAFAGGVVVPDDRMYTFSAQPLLEAVMDQVSDRSLSRIDSIAVVGHNNGISELVALLTDKRNVKSLTTLGISELEFSGSWSDLAKRQSKLIRRVKPSIKADERDDGWE